MSASLFLFSTLALILLFLLVWAVRPPRKIFLSVDDVFEALSEKRHYARLPQILQSLRHEDTDFLHTRGYDDLASRLRRERKRIALQYLNYLQKEYQLLLEASRILAKIAPEISPMDELGRLRLNVRFALWSRYLRCRLWFGLQPWEAFGILSDMEGDLTLRLEMATARIGERMALVPEFPLPLENRRRDSK